MRRVKGKGVNLPFAAYKKKDNPPSPVDIPSSLPYYGIRRSRYPEKEKNLD